MHANYSSLKKKIYLPIRLELRLIGVLLLALIVFLLTLSTFDLRFFADAPDDDDDDGSNISISTEAVGIVMGGGIGGGGRT